MSFAKPQILWALALLPLILIFMLWANNRRRSAMAKLGDGLLVEKLSATVNWRGRRLKRRLALITFAFLIIALARPQWGNRIQVVEQEGVQLMVALDVSKSMLAEDLKPNRLARAKLEISDLMNRLEGDELGLVLFSGASFIQFPLTSDYDTARAFLAGARPELISRPGTAIGDAIETALTGFDLEPRRSSQRVIIIMTDGEDHAGDPTTDPVTDAEKAAADGAIIYTIGFGSAQGEPIPEYDENGNLAGYKKDRNDEIVLSRLDEVTLQRIAGAANGRYFRVSAGGGELDSLAAEINALQAEQLENRFETQKIERFQLFLIPVLLGLILRELIPDRKRAVGGGTLVTGSPASNRIRAGRGALLTLLCATAFLLSACGTSPGRLVKDGNEAFASGDYLVAMEAYAEAQETAPDSAEPIYNSGNAQYRQERYPEAQESLQAALALSDGHLTQSAQYNLGNVAFQSAQWEAAIEAYKEALRINPNDEQAKYNLELALQQVQDQQNAEDSESSDSPEEEQQEEREQEQEDQPDQGEAEDQEQTADRGEQEQPESREAADPDSGTPQSPQTPTQTEGLTEEQARQLLESIGENSETLQERLQQIFVAPGPDPEKDW
jgi:Ca-activated chloride channel family protein